MPGEWLSSPLIEIAQALWDKRVTAQELIEAAIARHERFGDRLSSRALSFDHSGSECGWDERRAADTHESPNLRRSSALRAANAGCTRSIRLAYPLNTSGTAVTVKVTHYRQLYRSPNGDIWFLAHDPATGSALVRHQANAPSGGQVTDMELGAFLSGPRNPEHEALLRLIGASILDPHGGRGGR
jgi:hypothetical protein